VKKKQRRQPCKMTQTNRFTDIEASPKKLTPVFGYLTVPLVPLLKALEPISSKIDQLDRLGKLAKANCHYPSEHELTREESGAIFLYTIESEDNSFYRVINCVLRAEDRSTLKPWFPYLKLFDTAVQKLPSKRMNLWRGIARDVTKVYKKGDEFTWWAINSCTTSVGVITNFLGPNSTLFLIEAVNGKDISKYTNYPDEEEVILCPGTRLRVLGDPLDQPPMHIVHLKEITDDDNDEEPPTTKFASVITLNKNVERAKEQFTTLIKRVVEIKVETDRFGNRYEGEIKDNKKHGKGKMEYVNGNKYEGMWVNDNKTGQGIFTWSNGDRYEGYFKDNKEHGKGTFTWGPYDKWAGDKYEGDWFQGRRTGQGVYSYANGNRYTGQFQDDKQHGKGTTIFTSGMPHGSSNQHTGEYVNNARTGQGVYTWSNGDRYEGEFQDNQRHGRGKMDFANGDQYDGDWVDDERAGQGTFIFANGTRYEGGWENDQMHGGGILVLKNGRTQKGVWCDGERIH